MDTTLLEDKLMEASAQCLVVTPLKRLILSILV